MCELVESMMDYFFPSGFSVVFMVYFYCLVSDSDAHVFIYIAIKFVVCYVGVEGLYCLSKVSLEFAFATVHIHLAFIMLLAYQLVSPP